MTSGREKSSLELGFSKHLVHIVTAKGLVSFGVVQTKSCISFEFNVKWGGAKVPPLLCNKLS
jgi:hypothetical protein